MRSSATQTQVPQARVKRRHEGPRQRLGWPIALMCALSGSVVLVLAFAAFTIVLLAAGVAGGQAVLSELQAATTAPEVTSVLQQRFGQIAGVLAMAALLAIPMGALTYRLTVNVVTERALGPGSAIVAAVASMLAGGTGWFVDGAFNGLTFGMIGLTAAVVAGAWIVRERASDTAVTPRPPARP